MVDDMTKVFFSETKGGAGWWGTLSCPRCGKSQTLANPDEGRRAWYESRHSCEGRSWDGRP